MPQATMTSTAQSPQKGVSFARVDSGDSLFLRTPSIPERETGEKVMARLDYDQPFRPATVLSVAFLQVLHGAAVHADANRTLTLLVRCRFSKSTWSIIHC